LLKQFLFTKNIPQNGTLNCITTSDNYLHHFSITLLTATGATNGFSSLLKSIINRWTSAFWEVRCWEPKQLTQCSSL